MAKVNIFRCDICGKEIRWMSWEQSPGKVSVEISPNAAQMNFTHEEVCYPCSKEIVEAISRTIVTLKETTNA